MENNKVDQSTAKKIVAYGANPDVDETGKHDRYTLDDNVMQSADMTIMSGKGLNVTGITGMHKKKNSSHKGTEIGDDFGRMDTQEDEFDVNTIANIHNKNK